jgi:5-methyltetrahydrofolate--homocysteine methyltransferase
MPSELVDALVHLEEEKVLEIVEQRLKEGGDPFAILDDAKEGMSEIGTRFGEGTYFIPDLVYAGEIMKQISTRLEPEMAEEMEEEGGGTIVIGTVDGDIHDIGKDIVTFMLDANGFEVHDLGVDVKPTRFVTAIHETGASVLGLSGFLTLAFDSMKEAVEAVEEAGMRDQVKIMIGGGQVDEEVRAYTGADAYGQDASAAVSLAKDWLEA